MNSKETEILESTNSNLNAVVRNQALLFVQQKAMLEKLRAISKKKKKAVTLMENQRTEEK